MNTSTEYEAHVAGDGHMMNGSRKNQRSRLSVIAFAPAILFIACSESSAPEEGEAAVLTQGLFGTVVDTSGRALDGVLVQVAGQTTSTDADGEFSLEVSATGVAVAKFMLDGHLPALRRVTFGARAPSAVSVTLKARAAGQSLNADTGGTVTGSGQAAVTIDPGDLGTASQASVTGMVDVYVTPVDPSDDQEVLALTGSFDDGADLIESFGMMDVTIMQGGQPLDIAPGETLQIRIPAPAGLDTSALPLTTPLWSLNEETGRWVREGTAALDPATRTYVGEISHLSVWNADDIAASTCITGLAVDEATGDPIAGAHVVAKGNDYFGTSTANTGNDGRFYVPVRKDSEVLVSVTHDADRSATRTVMSGAEDTAVPPVAGDTRCLDVGTWQIGRKVIVDRCEDVVCDDTGSVCTIAVCKLKTGRCDTFAIDNGASCNGGAGVCFIGECIVSCDNVDCTSDNECVQDGVCDTSTGTCSTGDDQPVNTTCGEDGVCNGNGECVECNSPTQCDDDGNPCTVATCQAGQCGTANANNGTSCTVMSAAGVCTDGACVPVATCANADDCDDGNVCTVDDCIEQSCTHLPNDGVPCSVSDGVPGVCGGGACTGLCDDVVCASTSDCIVSGTCDAQTGACIWQFQPPASVCDDDGGNVCDGIGRCVECTEAEQCVSSRQCVENGVCNQDTNACETGNPVSIDTPCTEDRGRFCDGTGNCVECNADAQCADGETCNASKRCQRETAQTVFSDDTFDDSDWILIVRTTGWGGSAVGQQATEGGNLGDHRAVVTRHNGAPGGGTTCVYGLSLRNGAVYNPSVQGAITSIDYEEDARPTASGQSTGPVICQGSDCYVSFAGSTSPLGDWQTIQRGRLVAEDFVRVDPSVGGNGLVADAHPDFSAGGAPLELGFYRSICVNGGTFGVGAGQSEAGIDNWLVRVNRRTLAPSSPGPFVDDTFMDANWTLLVRTTGWAGSAAGEQVNDGGNPADHRTVVTRHNGAPGGGTTCTYALSMKDSAVYDPSIEGGITSIDYEEDARPVASDQSTGPVICQGSDCYVSFAASTGPLGNWQTAQRGRLLPTDFVRLDPSVGRNGLVSDDHPDFSATAAPLEFGFYRSVCVNGGTFGVGAGQAEAGIDNWSIRVNRTTLAPSGPGPFVDDAFENADWTLLVRTTGWGGSAVGEQVNEGGNPVDHRTVVTRHNGAPGGGRTCTYALSVKDSAVYDPSVEGSIASIDYEEDARPVASGQDTGPVICQGDACYLSFAASTGPLGDWQTAQRGRLLAEDFVRVDPSVGGSGLVSDAHPDFSATGAPIEFGFYRSICVNGGTFGVGSGQSEAGIDNWLIRVHRTTVAPSSPGPFADETFLDTEWTLLVRTTGWGGSAVGEQVDEGGNPDDYRTVVTRHNGAPGGGRTCTYAVSVKTTVVYDPTIEGAVTSVDYEEDARPVAGGQSTGPAIRQGGDCYVSFAASTGPLGDWQTAQRGRLLAQDFVRIDPTVGGSGLVSDAHPDFSASGAPMELGFYRSVCVNGGTFGVGAGQSEAGIDNWWIRLN